MSEPTRITVRGDAPYDVVVGHGLLGELAAMVEPQRPGRRRPPGEPCARRPRRSAPTSRSTATQAHAVEVPDGEGQKDLKVAAYLWDVLGQVGFTRTDAIVSVGGGATTDLAGFVAATWLRGVPVVHVPTTLLGMVDAAVGGKTGINTAAGKNLVGAFHPPAGVLCDLTALETLPQHDYVAGLAEVVKVGFTHDPRILELVEQRPEGGAVPGRAAHPRARRAGHRRQGAGRRRRPDRAGQREFLNYGHTLGHAIEKVEDYRWRHGAAVVRRAGLRRRARPAGRAARRRDRRPAPRRCSTRSGCRRQYAGDWAAVHAAMRVDKKSRGDRLRFVVLDALAEPAHPRRPRPGAARRGVRGGPQGPRTGGLPVTRRAAS